MEEDEGNAATTRIKLELTEEIKESLCLIYFFPALTV
jgi:hypothetical protein